jgi:hypothetical protein
MTMKTTYTSISPGPPPQSAAFGVADRTLGQDGGLPRASASARLVPLGRIPCEASRGVLSYCIMGQMSCFCAMLEKSVACKGVGRTCVATTAYSGGVPPCPEVEETSVRGPGLLVYIDVACWSFSSSLAASVVSGFTACGTWPGGRESVSATMLSVLAMWRMPLVYSATKSSCLQWRSLHGSDTRELAGSAACGQHSTLQTFSPPETGKNGGSQHTRPKVPCQRQSSSAAEGSNFLEKKLRVCMPGSRYCIVAPTCVADACPASLRRAPCVGWVKHLARSKTALVQAKASEHSGVRSMLAFPLGPPCRLSVSGRKVLENGAGRNLR